MGATLQSPPGVDAPAPDPGRQRPPALQGDLAALLAPLWTRKWLILIVACLSGFGAYVYFDREQRVYRSSTVLFLGRQSPDSILSGTPIIDVGDRRLNNEAALIQSQRIARRVARRLRIDVPPAALTASVRVEPGEDSDFLSIAAQSGDPVQAAAIANAFAEVYISSTADDYKASLGDAIRQGRLSLAQNPGVTIADARERTRLTRRIQELEAARTLARPLADRIEPARPNPVALSPRPKRNALFGFFLGLVATSLAMIGVGRLEARRFRSVEAIEDTFGLPLLAALPAVRRGELASGSPLPDAFREPLRRLDTTLDLIHADSRRPGKPRKVILVTGAQRAEGKSTLVHSLAQLLAEAGRRVAVVDSDTRHPAQHRLLETSLAPGLSDVLSGKASLGDSVHPGQGGGEDGEIWALPAGEPSLQGPQLVAGRELDSTLEALRDRFDQVLIDSPSPLDASDVLHLLSRVDGIILVGRINHSSAKAAEQLMRLLGNLPNAPILGVVANDVSADRLAR